VPNATTNLAVLVADTSYVTSLADSVIAEERAATTRLQPAISAIIPLQVGLRVTVALPTEVTAGLEALLSGSLYLTGSMSLGVAAALSVTSATDLAVAEAYALTPTLDVSLTDAVPIVLEPNDPKAAPLLTMQDLMLGQHPNVFTSPTTDFEAAGVVYKDVLEVLDGPNAAHYIIQRAEGNAVFVGEAPIAPSSPGPWAGEIRQHRDIIAQATAALVIDQALFFAPTVRYATLEVLVS
jgi:hypothetical protein